MLEEGSVYLAGQLTACYRTALTLPHRVYLVLHTLDGAHLLLFAQRHLIGRDALVAVFLDVQRVNEHTAADA